LIVVKLCADKTLLILKLQRNADLFQFLLKNASAEQLAWRSEPTQESLGTLISQLRDLEYNSGHLQDQWLAGLDQGRPQTPATADQPPVRPDDQNALAAFMAGRQQTIRRLECIPAERWPDLIDHEQFGRLCVAQLAEVIDRRDQRYLQQLSQIIRTMPANPLLSRALVEIEAYHRRYQPYLAQASSVLDIGVGSGLALQHIIQQNPHLVAAGVDLQDFRLAGVEVPLQLYNGEVLPFEAGQFDIALLFYVLHHCHNPRHLLSGAIRVTRRRLIIIEEFDLPNTDPTTLALTEWHSHQALGLTIDLPYHLFGKIEFETMLRQAGTVEIKQELLPSQTTRPVEKYLYVLGIDQTGSADIEVDWVTYPDYNQGD
jgi:SAM-dependent methyltransferase